ncbi:MAG: snare associated Golgi protein-domain-containing protein [Linnemannia gamsii]|nr:MAG: snare associated Golgi protein-domain-containing protein [Linnemannia gamsii]
MPSPLPPPPPPSYPTRPIKTIRERIEDASTKQKVAFCVGAGIVLAFIIVFFVFERQVFELIEPAVSYIRTSSAGMWVLASIMAATCIFPLLGYGVVSMICGYIYGMPKGFLPAFVGDLVGASICFWLYRLVFYNYISRKFGDNVEFKEMSKAVNKDGLFILLLIRLSSFPFGLLNAYFGAMTLLPFWKFFLATTLSTPRLFIAIFIGHNLSSLADPTLKGSDRTLKWGMNIIGVIIALAVGWYIYRHTKRRIERINAGLAPDESEEDETTRLGRQQQQQQQGSFGHESVDHDSFDLEEVTPHKYVAVGPGPGQYAGHSFPSGQGYSSPGQSYSPPAQGYSQPVQGYPHPGHSYPHHGQGYGHPGQGPSSPVQSHPHPGYAYPMNVQQRDQHQ